VVDVFEPGYSVSRRKIREHILHFAWVGTISWLLDIEVDGGSWDLPGSDEISRVSPRTVV
jgi:hypothetical protein